MGGSTAQSQSVGTSQNRGSDENEVGILLGNERFYRGNRTVTDFVGRDAQDVQDFVGVQQTEAAGVAADTGVRIESAISEELLEPPAEVDVNLPPPPPSPTSLYSPRLRVGFRFSRPPGDEVSKDLIRRLQASPRLHLTTPLEVSLEGETATLRGEVASPRERTLVELLVSFEPGISKVENELTVKASPES